ncbi:copper chaperone PCu(A)C [Pseudoxanthomonas gei]|uniref:Copper chaperone PCu(A)C n=1 Tax=Pseudoxanthomonas gei TaxID=1383030 RepID=A0ABX0AHW6_9GAMM|nr:copper chaperone PCu(A)C [Pseudoxanthomonas gei]NDK38828.1 copper chaperone PCu(A)C [Pseudoxanthomonas gei]
MHKRLIAKWALALLVAASTFNAAARECAPAMTQGWVRLPPVAMPMMAGFGRITNPCRMPMVIVSASSAAFGEVTLHETRNIDGVNRMRQVERLRVAPDDSVTLEPGGLHLMLMQPRAPLKEGSKVVVNFKLQDGREILSELVVRKPAP